MVDQVRTIEIQGKVHTLPDGVEVQVKFADGYGGLHNTPEEAGRIKAINDAEKLVQECIDWRNEEFDTQMLVDNRAAIIEALERIGK
jgi:hypothetical protein